MEARLLWESIGQLFGFYDITQVSWMCERDGIFYMSADSCHGQMILRGARRLYICSVSRTSPCRYLAHHIISSTSSPPLSHRRVRRSFSPGVDSFRFRAVWILSTRLIGVVDFVLRPSGRHCFWRCGLTVACADADSFLPARCCVALQIRYL